MLEKIIKFNVRYAETDQMGYVHHGNYAQYFEMGRIEWLRSLGISYKEMEAKGVMLPVASLQTNFKKPAKYDDQLTLVTSLKELPTAKIIFEYQLFDQTENLLSTGQTTLVFVSSSNMRPIKCPDYVLEVIKKEMA